MKHFVLNENRIFDLWEYIWLEISTALTHSNCQLHRAVYAFLPPPSFVFKKKRELQKEEKPAGQAAKNRSPLLPQGLDPPL